MGEFTELFTETKNFVWRDAGFRFFASQVDFDENGQPPVEFAGDVLKPFREFRAVNRLHNVKKLDCAPSFVRLQMPDQMPQDLVFFGDGAEFKDFGPSLLNPILTEIADARNDRFADASGRDGFADGDQCDLRSLTACAFAGRRNSLIDCFQPRLQVR